MEQFDNSLLVGFATILPFLVYATWFLVFYLILRAGLKLLDIEEISGRQLAIFTFALFTVIILLAEIPSYSMNILVFAASSLLLMKYHLGLERRKLWLYFGYIFVINLAFSAGWLWLQSLVTAGLS